jgi:beta-glucanase (GH16 family)
MNLIPAPVPPGVTWKLIFADEFNGTTLDTNKWSGQSTSQSDAGQGNLPNQQLEWNQLANISVADGFLTITAKREAYTSIAGNHYEWTSGLLTSSPSFAFRYGYIEERAKLPAEKGFWPAFWTWQQPGSNSWQETDVYEFFSDNHTKLYLTSQIGAGGGTVHRPLFNPSSGYHTYGADIQPTGTTWYIDGVKVAYAPGAPSEPTNLITNLAVYSKIPPASTTHSATKSVDYIRVYSHDPNVKAVVPQQNSAVPPPHNALPSAIAEAVARMRFSGDGVDTDGTSIHSSTSNSIYKEHSEVYLPHFFMLFLAFVIVCLVFLRLKQRFFELKWFKEARHVGELEHRA